MFFLYDSVSNPRRATRSAAESRSASRAAPFDAGACASPISSRSLAASLIWTFSWRVNSVRSQRHLRELQASHIAFFVVSFPRFRAFINGDNRTSPPRESTLSPYQTSLSLCHPVQTPRVKWASVFALSLCSRCVYEPFNSGRPLRFSESRRASTPGVFEVFLVNCFVRILSVFVRVDSVH